MNGKLHTDLLSSTIENLAVFTQWTLSAEMSALYNRTSFFHMQWENRIKSKVLTTGPSLPAGPGLPGWPGRPWERKSFMFLERNQLTQHTTSIFFCMHACTHTEVPSYQCTLFKQDCRSYHISTWSTLTIWWCVLPCQLTVSIGKYLFCSEKLI